MQSGQDNQSQSPSQPVVNPNLRVENQPVIEGEKPTDFVKRILAERAGAQPAVQAPVQTVEQDVAVAKAQVEAESKPLQKEPEPSFDFVEPKREMGPAPAAKVEEEVPTGDPAEDAAPGSLPANYKLLKSTYKETKQKYQEAENKRIELEAELEKYKTGTVVPEILQEKENKIAELSVYEKMFNVKGSAAYKEQVVQPLSNNRKELNQLFKDYEIPESEVENFTALTNRADRNRFLSEHFDSRGADQAEQLLQQSANIRAKAKEIEGGSSSAIQTLEAEQVRIEAEREGYRRQHIADNARDSWVRALSKIRADGRIKELIPKSNDPEFNARFVTPILTAASVEYGKFVTKLAESGVRELTPELAEYAANMSLRAHAQAVAQQTRDAALEYADQAEAGTRIGNGYFRPAVGGGVPSITSKQPATPTLDQGVDGLLSSIIAKRR